MVERIAVYKGETYQAGRTKDGEVILETKDENKVSDGFHLCDTKKGRLYHKEVPLDDVDELYYEYVMATYKGSDFCVMKKAGDHIYIESYQQSTDECLALGMEEIDRFIYGKWIPESEAKIWIDKFNLK